jgi:hypothetical protein
MSPTSDESKGTRPRCGFCGSDLLNYRSGIPRQAVECFGVTCRATGCGALLLIDTSPDGSSVQHPIIAGPTKKVSFT